MSSMSRRRCSNAPITMLFALLALAGAVQALAAAPAAAMTGTGTGSECQLIKGIYYVPATGQPCLFVGAGADALIEVTGTYTPPACPPGDTRCGLPDPIRGGGAPKFVDKEAPSSRARSGQGIRKLRQASQDVKDRETCNAFLTDYRNIVYRYKDLFRFARTHGFTWEELVGKKVFWRMSVGRDGTGAIELRSRQTSVEVWPIDIPKGLWDRLRNLRSEENIVGLGFGGLNCAKFEDLDWLTRSELDRLVDLKK